MSHRLIGAIALLVVLGAGAVLVPGWIGGDDGAPATTAGQAQPSTSASPRPSSGPSADPVAGAGAPEPSASASAGRVTTEVIVEPPAATSTAPSETGPGSLPSLQALSTLTIGELPKRATSAQGVLAGWPKRALPVIAGSRVRSTSASPGPGVVQLGLDAVVPVDPAAVMRRYRSALAAYGFVEQPAADPNVGTAIGFTHGADSVSLTVSRVARGTSYVVFAVIHPES